MLTPAHMIMLAISIMLLALPIPPPVMETEVKGNKYKQKEPEDWSKIGDNNIHNANLLPFTDGNKDLILNIIDAHGC